MLEPVQESSPAEHTRGEKTRVKARRSRCCDLAARQKLRGIQETLAAQPPNSICSSSTPTCTHTPKIENMAAAQGLLSGESDTFTNSCSSLCAKLFSCGRLVRFVHVCFMGGSILSAYSSNIACFCIFGKLLTWCLNYMCYKLTKTVQEKNKHALHTNKKTRCYQHTYTTTLPLSSHCSSMERPFQTSKPIIYPNHNP